MSSTPKPVAESKSRPQPGSPCPCGSGRTFGECCEPVIARRRPAGTAEELMRSRFTAHAIGDFEHLHRTYLKTARLPYVEEKETGDIAWTRLEIHAHETGPQPDKAFVEFTAFYRVSDAEQKLEEKSEFQRIDGAWFYARTMREGPAPVKSGEPKVGRNDPCPCGSGKKYKKCCGQ